MNVPLLPPGGQQRDIHRRDGAVGERVRLVGPMMSAGRVMSLERNECHTHVVGARIKIISGRRAGPSDSAGRARSS